MNSAGDERLYETAGVMSELARILDRKINPKVFRDRLLLQKSVYLLNIMDAGPAYSFGMYVRGPYSSDLARDYYCIEERGVENTDYRIPEDPRVVLSEFLSKGLDFMEAASTIRVIADENRSIPEEDLPKVVINMKPWLKKEVPEAYRLLKSRNLLTTSTHVI